MKEKTSEKNEFIYVTKISSAEIGWDQSDIKELFNQKKDVGKIASLYRIYGTVQDYKEGTGANGDWIKFLGGFEAINMSNGNIFRSSRLFLPDAVTGILQSELQYASSKDGFLGLQFSYEVQAECTGKLIGYQFKVKNLLAQKEETDQLLAMRREFFPIKVNQELKK